MRDGGVSGPSRAGGCGLSTYPKTIVSPGQSHLFRNPLGISEVPAGWAHSSASRWGCARGPCRGRSPAAVQAACARLFRTRTSSELLGAATGSPQTSSAQDATPHGSTQRLGRPTPRACGRHDRTQCVAWASARASERGSGDVNELVVPEIVVRLFGCVRSSQGSPKRSAQVLLEHGSRGHGSG
jgi:hypothetical protein